MNTPWTRILAMCCVLSAVTLGARAQLPPVTVMEASLETTSAAVHFPASLAGRIQVQGCPQCVDQTLQLDGHTQFYLNGQVTTLSKVAAASMGAKNNLLTVHYRLQDKVVTRVDMTVFPS